MRSSLCLAPLALALAAALPGYAAAQDAPRIPTGGTDATFARSVAPTIAGNPVPASIWVHFDPPPPPPPPNYTQDLGCTGGWVGQRIWMMDGSTNQPLYLVSNTCAAPAVPPPNYTKDLGCTGGWVGQRIWMMDGSTNQPLYVVSNTCAAPPPPSIPPASDPTICAAKGGMPYTTQPVNITATVGQSSFSGGAVYSYASRSIKRGAAGGSFSATISFGGTTRTVSLACTRLNTSMPTVSDSCDYSQSFNVGPGTFVVDLSATSPLAADFMNGQNAPFSVGAWISQVNCR